MRLIKSFCLHSVTLLATAAAAFATIGADLQMQLGNASGATADTSNHTHFLIQRPQYTLDYNDTKHEPNFVSWDLTTADVGSSGRSDNFYQDTTLPAGFYQVKTSDYSGSGYDRGHMCPSADRTITTTDNNATFYMSNMVPQSPDNNQGVWASFETYCRTLAGSGNEILITSGPSGGNSTVSSGVAIPGYTWKIAVVVPAGSGTALSRIDASTRVIAIKIPNIAGVRSDPWQNYITNAAEIEADTGFTFFTALSSPVAAALRAKKDGLTATGSPAIVTQPSGASAPVGGNATFTVSATGNATLTYQWFKGDLEIDGATSATLTLTNVQASDADTYTAVVTNSLGSATSNGATLVITGIAPSITTSPVTQSVAAGTTATLSVVAAGSPTLTYQWRKGGVNVANGTGISGATAATLTLTNVQAANTGSYDVVVTNSVSSATSAAATLTVTPAAPTITSAPVATTAAPASTATFTVVATGTAPLSYQWRKGGVAITGNASATTSTLTIAGVAAGDAGSYDVVVSNGVNPDAVSTAVTLTVGTAVSGGSYGYAGGTYTQDFNTLPLTGSFTFTGDGPYVLTAAQPNGVGASGMTGWSLAKYTGTGVGAQFGYDDGSNIHGSVYSYGTTNATDRALGSIGSGSTSSYIGVTLVNTTGQTITEFTLSYTGEQWRRGTGAANTFGFSYSVGGTDLKTGTFVDAPALSFTAPYNGTPTAVALDGNAAAYRTAITGKITGISWAPGQALILRWADVDDTGSDDAIAIDDVSFTTPVAGAAVAPAVASTSPANGASGVPGNSPITVTFDSPVTTTGAWFTISSTFNGSVAATVTGGPKVFTLTPPINFADSDTVTVGILASHITDQATGSLHPAVDTTVTFTTAAATAPSITTQPTAQTVAAGGTATFTVAAGGTPPFNYQWKKDGTAITGNVSATTATLVLTNAQAADAGSYTVTVSNGVSPEAVSAAAALSVTATAPTITTQPVSQTVDLGTNTSFTVVATGSTPLTYQWRKNGVVIADATSATLSFTGVTAADGGIYEVVVSNGVLPNATSSSAILTVNTATGPQTNYSGGTYTQNFDTLPATGSFIFSANGPYPFSGTTPPAGIGATGLSGWTFANYGGTSATASIRIDDGNNNAGGIISYGTTSATDRALGSLASASQIGRFGLTFVNTTGQTITQFTLGYTGEQWRNGGNTTAQTLGFSYSVGATDINTGTFTAASALDFVSVTNTAVAIGLDGNAAGNRTVIAPVTITGLSWAPGQTLVLRWTDLNDPANDHGLAIDDLSFTTPATAAAQTISFPQPADHLAIDQPFALYAISDSGLPVTFTLVSGPATLSDGVITLTGTAGSVVVRASQAGNGQYLAATDVTRTITISPPPTVTGTYFGTFGSGGTWALYVRSDRTATYIAYLPSRSSAIVSNFTVNADGTFSSTGTEVKSSAVAKVSALSLANPEAPVTRTASAASSYTLSGSIAGNGAITGSLIGLGETFTGAVAATTGAAQSSAGFYTATALGTDSGTTYAIVGASGETVVVTTGAAVDGATGTINASGQLSVTTAGNGTLSLTIDSGAQSVNASLTPSGSSTPVSYAGLAAGVTPVARVVNLSVRSSAGTGSQTLIVGFVVNGTGNKTLMIRGVGPAISQYVSTALADPTMRLLDNSDTELEANNDWGGGPTLTNAIATLGATPFAANSKDAAIYRTLSAGVYSFHVFSNDGAQGVTVAELYDADPTPVPAQVVNISARTQVGTGDNILIAGFVITGNSPKTLLIRGVGPTLIPLGITDALIDPQLYLYQGNTLLASNDNWGGSDNLKTAFSTVGASSLASDTSKDAALLITLQPGVYSAQVSGVGGTTGVGLVEIYLLP